MKKSSKSTINYRILFLAIFIASVIFITHARLSTPSTLKPTSNDAYPSIGIVFIKDNNVWLDSDNTLRQITYDGSVNARINPALHESFYTAPKFSLASQKIAYLKSNDGGSSYLLGMTDLISGKSSIINSFIKQDSVFQWSTDGSKLYYTISINTRSTQTNTETISITRLNLVNNSSTVIGKFVNTVGCGGGSSDPSDGLEYAEHMLGSGDGITVFSVSSGDQYILHTIRCDGVGTVLFDLQTGKDTVIDEKLTNAVIAPNGNLIAGIEDNSIVIYDVPSHSYKYRISSSSKPSLLAWSKDGKDIIFSSKQLTKTLKFDFITTQNTKDANYSINATTLYQFSLSERTPHALRSFPAHNIKPIYYDARTSQILYIGVENSDRLFAFLDQKNQGLNEEQYMPSVYIGSFNTERQTSYTLFNKISNISISY